MKLYCNKPALGQELLSQLVTIRSEELSLYPGRANKSKGAHPCELARYPSEINIQTATPVQNRLVVVKDGVTNPDAEPYPALVLFGMSIGRELRLFLQPEQSTGKVFRHFQGEEQFGIAAPRIAVAALNPHGGENGAMGDEEDRIIRPAIGALKTAGLEVSGPYPADTLFHDDARQTHDVVLCLYHDQALIPLKTLDFYGGVNTTLGLPFIRTSPDHGTAEGLAGTGKARPDSMIAAIELAARISQATS